MNEYCITGSLDNIGFVALCVRYKNKWTLCYNKRPEVRKWDHPGGHVEENEQALTAAKRELYEETGAIDYDIVPVWDYRCVNDDGSLLNNGRCYYVLVREFSQIPAGSEMDRVDFFDELPPNYRYPDQSAETFKNFKRAEKYAQAHYI